MRTGETVYLQTNECSLSERQNLPQQKSLLMVEMSVWHLGPYEPLAEAKISQKKIVMILRLYL